MAELGHEVIGVDIDPGKVAKLSAGEIPFYEPDLAEMLQANRQHIKNQRLLEWPS